MSATLTLKTVIRCAAYAKSLAFYNGVLGLPVLDDWDTPQGKGCILGFGEGGAGGQLELYEMTPQDSRYDAAFGRPFTSDKIDLQFGTHDLEGWAGRIRGKWDVDGPIEMPWGEKRLRLRDPDGLLVLICQDA